jgi:DNA repair protein RadD
LNLYDYQQEAVEAVYRAVFERRISRVLVEAPTGAGKSVIIARLIADAVAEGVPVVCLQHVRELVEQNAAALGRLLPGVAIGVYAASLGRKQLDTSVVFASIQSLARAKTIPFFGLAVIDEAHMIPRRESAQYQAVLAQLRERNPSLVTVGLTATPYRLDSGYLYEGDDAPFDEIAYRIGLRTLIDRGRLVPPVAFAGSAEIDLQGVRRDRHGEYSAAEVEARAIAPELVERVCEDVTTAIHEQGRRAAIVFASGVLHAQALHEEFGKRGLRSGVVTADSADRDEVIAGIRAGELDVVVNVGVLTTGFDAPRIDVVAIARPTASTALYIQMVGRGLRTAEGKADCLVLDYGGNVVTHGPVDAPRPNVQRGGDGKAPFKVCPSCRAIVATAVWICPHCSYEWKNEAKHDGVAFGGSLLTSPEDEEGWRTVDRVEMRRHTKAGSPDSVRVTYQCGLEFVDEWVCPEHAGYPRVRYEMWCRETGAPVCDSVTEALFFVPSIARVRVKRDGKYWRVQRREVRA